MDRGSKGTFEPGVWCKAELVLQINQSHEALPVDVEACEDGLDAARQLILFHGGQFLLQETKRPDRGLGDLNVQFCVLIIFAEQKVLLVAAQLEQLYEKILGRRSGRGGRVGGRLIARLGFRPDKIDYADKQEPENAHGSQSANLERHADVGQPKHR